MAKGGAKISNTAFEKSTSSKLTNNSSTAAYVYIPSTSCRINQQTSKTESLFMTHITTWLKMREKKLNDPETQALGRILSSSQSTKAI